MILRRVMGWLFWGTLGTLLAQAPADLLVKVPPGAEVRSPAMSVLASEELQISLAATAGATPFVRVFVHHQDGVLAGVEDPDSTEPVFHWRAPADGNYYVLLRNQSALQALVRIGKMAVRAPPTPESNYSVVRVFYATERERVNASAGVSYGTELSGEGLTYGHCDISMPREHRLGELEGPSIFRLEFRSDPEKHVQVLSVSPERAVDFFAGLSRETSKSKTRQILVFVHGFNVSFEDGARRAAQIAYDLAFDGPTLLFSWPSQDSMLPAAYRKDERNAALSASTLEGLLRKLSASSPPPTIHVIAHSMGNRVVAGALELIAEGSQPGEKPKVKEVALFAPDIDAALFKQAIGSLMRTASRVTLYASSQDEALVLSRHNAGYPRAGESGNGLIVARGMDTIDASLVNTSLLGLKHSYYADNTSVLSDLFGLIRGTPAKERFGLTVFQTNSGPYWRFRPAIR